MVWTIAECDTYISTLKQKLVEALGSATEETIKEGNSGYAHKYLVESIQKQIEYFENQKALAEALNSTDKSSVAYIGSREYGV